MSRLRDKYAVVGSGNSRLGHLGGVSALGLLEDAIKNVLDEAGLTSKDIDGLVCRGSDDIYAHHQMMGARLGINAAFGTSVARQLQGVHGEARQVPGAEIALVSGHGGNYVCHSPLRVSRL